MARPLVLALLLVACTPRPAPVPAASAGAEREAGTITIDGEPNGLAWHHGSLFIADEGHDWILRATGDGAIELVSQLPPAERHGLGQPVFLSDGAILVPQLHSGEVFRIEGGAPTPIPGLDPSRHRLGLAVAPDGAIYTACSVHTDAHEHVGAVARLGLDGTEVDVVTDLRKPVGLAILDGMLVVTDQLREEVLAVPLDDLGTPPEILAHVESPDFAVAGDGAVYVASEEGTVTRVTLAGDTEVVVSGLSGARGVAYDPDGRRLFVAEHGASRAIRVIEVP